MNWNPGSSSLRLGLPLNQMAHEITTADDVLIDAALRGDGKAWEVLVQKYGQLIWSIGRSCGLSAADADDLIQTVFGTLVQSLERIEQRDRLPGWITITAKREAWRISERARRERPVAPESMVDTESWVDQSLDDLERRQAVRLGMVRIGSRCRQLLIELFGAAQVPTYEQVAGRLGLKPNSVGPVRQRCLEGLLAELREIAPEFFPSSS